MISIPLPLLIAPLIATTLAQSVWIEAETTAEKSIQNNGWYSSVKEGELSGGDLLAHWGARVGTAQYTVAIPEAANYTLWLRANPVGSKLEVRIDGNEWREVDFKADSHENINIASDNKPDLRFVAWVRAGSHELKAGKHEMSVRFTSENNHHGMLDCFCLTTDVDWKPSGILKPGEDKPHWPVPEITSTNLDKWIKFIRPSAGELGWRNVRWHRSLSEAAEEAEQLKRPILLWAMNGHPCGET
jgi:hypothetical protein